MDGHFQRIPHGLAKAARIASMAAASPWSFPSWWRTSPGATDGGADGGNPLGRPEMVVWKHTCNHGKSHVFMGK